MPETSTVKALQRIFILPKTSTFIVDLPSVYDFVAIYNVQIFCPSLERFHFPCLSVRTHTHPHTRTHTHTHTHTHTLCQVVKGTYDSHPVAVKLFHKTHRADSLARQYKRLREELTVLSHLDHPR